MHQRLHLGWYFKVWLLNYLGYLFTMQISRPHARSAEQTYLGMEPMNLHVNNSNISNRYRSLGNSDLAVNDEKLV